jgi:tetrahydromethanopterin S-methyltransferase subunit F
MKQNKLPEDVLEAEQASNTGKIKRQVSEIKQDNQTIGGSK